MELVGSSWWPLPSAVGLGLGGGGGGGGLMLDVELTTTLVDADDDEGGGTDGPDGTDGGGGADGGPDDDCDGPAGRWVFVPLRDCVCGAIKTVSPRVWLPVACCWCCCCGPRGHHPLSTLMALLTSACNSAALSLPPEWATFKIFNPVLTGHKNPKIWYLNPWFITIIILNYTKHPFTQKNISIIQSINGFF